MFAALAKEDAGERCGEVVVPGSAKEERNQNYCVICLENLQTIAALVINFILLEMC